MTKDILRKEIEAKYERYCDDDVKIAYSMNEVADVVGEADFLEAVFSGKYIRLCRNCGQVFIARTATERYCNRLVDMRHTCKDVGPANTRKADPITDAFDRARRLHLWRRKKAGGTKMACALYDEWLRYSQEAEAACRNGEISLDTFREMIGRNYSNDAAGSTRDDERSGD